LFSCLVSSAYVRTVAVYKNAPIVAPMTWLSRVWLIMVP
jgi:hypothetical protein